MLQFDDTVIMLKITKYLSSSFGEAGLRIIQKFAKKLKWQSEYT